MWGMSGDEPGSRSLRRRTSDEVGIRAMVHKYPHIPSTAFDAMIDTEGLTPLDHVKGELARISNKNEYIKSRWWVDFEETFNLCGTSVYDNLPEPGEAEPVDDELMRVLLKPVSENPSQRSAEDMESHFLYVEELNLTELYGSLCACRPQPNLSPKHREEMEQVMLTYMAKYDVQTKYESVWTILKLYYEQVLHRRWLNSVKAGRHEFIEANWKVICLFINEDALYSVEGSIINEEQLHLPDLRQCMTSPVGASLYEAQGKQLQWLQFVEAIEVGVKNLVSQD